MANDPDFASYSEAETVARREAALRNMLTTPHKPHEAIKRRRGVESKKGG